MRLLKILPAVTPLALSAQVSPVQKVVEMLKEMSAKGTEEMAKEAAVFKEIEATVHKRLIDTDIEIEQNTARVAKQTAAVAANGAAASKLEGEVAAHEAENSKRNAALQAKIKARAEERSLYQTELKDLSESEDALTRAISVLKSQEGSIPASLIQQVAATVPAARANLEAYIQQGQPQQGATAYEFQGGGIVKMLQDLLKEFKEKLHETRTAEMNRDNAFQTWKVDMEYEIKGVEKEIADKTKEAGEHRGKEGQAAKKRDQAQAALEAAKQLKKETELYFRTQSESFKQNQETRKAELGALGEAIKIMSSAEVSGAADKHMPGLLQTGTSFLQTGSTRFLNKGGKDKTALLQKVSALISQRNSDEFGNKSRALSMLSAQMLTGGTFDKVIKMIEGLIKKLEEEGAAELEHKQWCDKELKLTGEDKDKFQSEVETLSADKEAKEAAHAENVAQIKELTATVKELVLEMAKSTKERNEQKSVNEETIAESKAAQEATAKAIEVLEAFYSQTKGGEAFLQQDPEIASYSGMGGASGGVIGLIETIQSDFAQLESDTTADETAAAAEYAAFMKTSKKDKEEKEQTIHETKLENTSIAADIRRVAKSLAKSTEQLGAIQKYWGELQPMCVVKHVSYEERVAQREAEVQALKDAYAVLSEQSGEV